MELGRNIRLTFFFTLCLTWHIMTKYGTLEKDTRQASIESNTSCINGTGCADPVDKQENESENCGELDWFWKSGRGLGWDDPSSDEKISTFAFFYVTDALTCALLFVFIIRWEE